MHVLKYTSHLQEALNDLAGYFLKVLVCAAYLLEAAQIIAARAARSARMVLVAAAFGVRRKSRREDAPDLRLLVLAEHRLRALHVRTRTCAGLARSIGPRLRAPK